jgi:hypothetical protein
MGVRLAFEMNQAAIARTLCLQKEVVNNDCQGKCYLQRQLEKEARRKSQTADSFFKHKLESFYHFPIISLFKNPLISGSPLPLVTFEFTFYHRQFISGIFHPPQI